MVIPKKLCDKCDIEYRLVDEPDFYGKREQKKRYREFDAFTSNMVFEADRDFYAQGLYNNIIKSKNDKIVIIDGGIWEICTSFYRIHGYFKNDVIDNPEVMIYAFPELKYDSVKRTSMLAYVELLNLEREEGHITDIDRLYWECRVGGWLADIYHSFNLYENITIINPLNCRFLLELLFGFECSSRIHRQHEKELTKMWCSEVSDIPYGDEINTRNKRAGTIRAGRIQVRILRNMVKAYGIGNTFDYYATKIKNKLK